MPLRFFAPAPWSRKIFVAVATIALIGLLFLGQWAARRPSLTSSAPAPASVPALDGVSDHLASVGPATPDPAAAILQLAGRQVSIRPNLHGEFPRVFVESAALITAEVPFFGAQRGEALAIQAEDGGGFIAGVTAGEVAVGDGGRARFEFRASATDGLNRITLRRGGETRVLEFWIGPEAPVLVRR